MQMNSNAAGLNINPNVTNKTNDKSLFIKNFTQFFKKGSNALGQKLGHLFKKKDKTVENSRINGKFAIVKETNTNYQNTNFVPNTNNKLNENKQIFKIEEDEEGKEKIYHLEDDDDDEDDYEEDEEELKDECEKDKAKNKNDKMNLQEKQENKGSVTSTEEKSNKIIHKNGLRDNEIRETQDSSQRLENKESVNDRQTGKIANDKSIDSIENNYDIHAVVHRIYYKGSPVNIEDLPLIKFSKIKNKSNLLSMMGISRKLEEKKYLAFFDENYLYFLKDIEVDKKDKNLRKIGNKINLNLFYNANIGNNGVEYVHIALEFLKEPNSEDTIFKDLYFENIQAERFVNLLDVYLRRLNIQLFEEENYRRNTQESDEKEINKKEDEEENEEEDEEN